MSEAKAQYLWDGANAGDNTADGGTGDWDASGAGDNNWVTGGASTTWLDDSDAEFGVFGGTVTISGAGTRAVNSITFDADAYFILGGTIALSGPGSTSISVNNAGETAVIASTIADGTGTGLTKAGAGALTLSGNNTYSGATTLGAGFLEITGTTASSSVNIGAGELEVDGGTFTANSAVVLNSANSLFDVNGSETLGAGGSLSLNSAGATVDFGVPGETLSAGTITTVEDSVIIIGSGSTLAGLANTLNNGGIINVGDGGAVTDVGAINNLGTGVINFSGAGTLDSDTDAAGAEPVTNDGQINLQGNNSQTVTVGSNGNNDLINQGTGQVNVNAGRLDVTGTITNGSTSASGVDINAGGTLNAGGLTNNNSATVTNDGTLNSGAQISNNAGATFTSTGTVTGGIANSGTVTAGGTFSGAIVNQGGTFTANTNLVGNSTVTINAGAITANNGATFSGITTLTQNGGTINGAGSFSANSFVQNGGSTGGSVDINVNTLDLNGGTISAGTSVTSSGAQSLAGTVNGALDGAGAVTVDGNSTVRGSIASNNVTINNGVVLNVINAGSLDANSINVSGTLTTDGGSLAATSVVTIGATGSFNVQGNETIGAATGGGAVALSNGVTLDTGGGGASGTFSGIISGLGQLSKSGAGTLTLSGNNTYSGGTRLNGGTLDLDHSNALGTGALTILGSTVDFAAGISVANAIDLQNNATLSIGAGTATHSGAIGQTGGTFGISKTGGGTLILSGTGTYSGATAIAAGILQAGAANAFSQSSAYTVSAGSTLDLAGFNQSIGSLVGAGNVTLGAATLTAGSDGTSTTFSGIISGTGGLTKNGVGTLTLTGNNTFTGALSVAGGKVVNNGTMASTLTVANGIYGGTGTTGALTATGGTVAPGNSIGTLTVNGALNLGAGSTYAVEVDAAGNSDLIDVTGTVTLGGGTLSVLATGGGTYGPSTDYIIIANDGADAVTGTFGTVTTDLAFLSATVNYAGGTGNDVALNLTRNDTSFASLGTSFNQVQSATALAGLGQTAGTDSATVYNTILGLSGAQARAAFDSASGEIHASAQHMLAAVQGLYRQSLNDRGKRSVSGLAVTQPINPTAYSQEPEPVHTARAVTALGYAEAYEAAKEPSLDYADARVKAAWAGPLGGAGSIGSVGNAATLNWWAAGIAGGYEGRGYAGSGQFVVGVSGGYLHGSGTAIGRSSAVTGDSLNIGSYGAWTDGGWTLSGAVGYSATSLKSSRTVSVGSLSRTATASYWTHTLGLTAEASRNIDFGSFTISPLATVDAGWAGHGGATETGAGALNLTLAPESRFWFETGLGIEFAKRFTTRSSRRVTLSARAVWEHSFGAMAPDQAMTLAGSQTAFTVRGAALGRDRLRVGLGMGVQSGRTTVSARYEGTFFGGQNRHAASGSLSVGF